MITVNNKDNTNYKDMKVEDIIGFALNNGYFFIDMGENHLVSFWTSDISCEVKDLSDADIFSDSTLNELVTKLNICDIKDVIKVFTDESEFTLNLTW